MIFKHHGVSVEIDEDIPDNWKWSCFECLKLSVERITVAWLELIEHIHFGDGEKDSHSDSHTVRVYMSINKHVPNDVVKCITNVFDNYCMERLNEVVEVHQE